MSGADRRETHDDDTARAVAARYRAAVDALDERASDATRASILAAAARHAGARPLPTEPPIDASPNGGAPGGRRGPQRRMRLVDGWRLPFAAAATVMLSTIVGLIALHVDDAPGVLDDVPLAAETPDEAPAGTPAPQAADASAGSMQGVAASAPQAAEATTTTTAATPATVAQLDAQRQAKEARERAAREQAERARAEREAQQRKAQGARDSGPATAPRTAPPPPGTRSTVPAEERTRRERRAGERDETRRSREERPFVPDPVPPAPPAPAKPSTPPKPTQPPTPPGGDARKPPGAPAPLSSATSDRGVLALRSPAREQVALRENDPVRWLEYIVLLRQQGRAEDADAELARFRARYPDVPIPDAAKP